VSGSVYSTTQGRIQVSSYCPKCGYRLSNFRTSARCFNCDYAERGSDGPWATDATDRGLILRAESIWDCAAPLFIADEEFNCETVIHYLAQRRILDLALTCDQLRASQRLHHVLPMRNGQVLLARIWHVRKGFVGIHATRVEWIGGDPPYARDERRTMGACQGGGVWFGTVTPQTPLIVGEGIETTLSAMILWGAKAGVATLGTEGLKSLVLPQAARRIIIAADNDLPLPGKKFGIGLRDARIARRLWLQEEPTIDVEIKCAPPPKGGEAKCDWNDVLMESCHV
jgi:Toprim domain-containing protein